MYRKNSVRATDFLLPGYQTKIRLQEQEDFRREISAQPVVLSYLNRDSKQPIMQTVFSVAVTDIESRPLPVQLHKRIFFRVL